MGGGVFCFCMIVKLCAVGPMSIFDEHYLLVFFVFLTSITTSVAMHACFLRERKGVESFFSFLCMNSNRSAGGGRRGGAWRVYTAGGVRKRENLG